MILTKEMLDFVRRVKSNYKPNVRNYSRVVRVEEGRLLYTDGFTVIRSNTGLGVPSDMTQCVDLNGHLIEYGLTYPSTALLFSSKGKEVASLREDVLSSVAVTLSTKDPKPGTPKVLQRLSIHSSFVRFVDPDELRLTGELIRVNPLFLAKAFAVVGELLSAEVVGGDLLKLDGRHGTAVIAGIQPREGD
jgi:hypothetical protein